MKKILVLLISVLCLSGCVDNTLYDDSVSNGTDIDKTVEVTTTRETKEEYTTTSITTSTITTTQEKTEDTTTVKINQTTVSKKTTNRVTTTIAKKTTVKNNSNTQGRKVYKTPTGKKYHYDSNCNGGTYIETTMEEALSLGLDPCKKCVLN